MPESLTAFNRSDDNNYIYLNIKSITLDFDGQFTPAKYGPGYWLFHFTNLRRSGSEINSRDLFYNTFCKNPST
jgi:hypothetical protein